MVWAGINVGELTNLYIIQNGSLIAQRYANKILRPYVIASSGNSFCLMQDNARPHTACLVENFFEAETVQDLE